MKRVLFSFILILLVIPLFAEYTYYQPFPNCFSVDLDGTYDGAGEGSWNKGDYNQNDMVGLMGMTWAEGSNAILPKNTTYLIEFQFIDLSGTANTEPWMFSSASDPSLQIPFGLDFVVKHVDTEQHVYPVGYRNAEDTEPDALEDPISITTSGTEDWSAIWMDIVLVLPDGLKENMAKKGMIRYAAADDYRAAFQVSFKKIVNDVAIDIGSVFHVYITGYYGDLYDSSTMSLVFSVNPLPSSRTLNLTDMDGSSQAVEIGSYFYTTSALRSAAYTDGTGDGEGWTYSSPFELFVSSSSDPTNPGEEFCLTHINDPTMTIPFEIGLDSDYSAQDVTNWYDGTGYMGPYTGSSSGHDYPYSYVEGTGDASTTGRAVFETSRPGDMASLTFDDEGSILFRLTEKVTEEYKSNLVGGYYSADIYFHLVSNY